jgi:hypothetical protein
VFGGATAGGNDGLSHWVLPVHAHGISHREARSAMASVPTIQIRPTFFSCLKVTATFRPEIEAIRMKRDSDSILASLDNNTATNRMLSVRVNGREKRGGRRSCRDLQATECLRDKGRGVGSSEAPTPLLPYSISPRPFYQLVSSRQRIRHRDQSLAAFDGLSISIRLKR